MQNNIQNIIKYHRKLDETENTAHWSLRKNSKCHGKVYRHDVGWNVHLHNRYAGFTDAN